MTEPDIRTWRQQLRESLGDWREPDGFLVPTEPDAEERAKCRGRLEVAIEVLGRVLGEQA